MVLLKILDSVIRDLDLLFDNRYPLRKIVVKADLPCQFFNFSVADCLVDLQPV